MSSLLSYVYVERVLVLIQARAYVLSVCPYRIVRFVISKRYQNISLQNGQNTNKLLTVIRFDVWHFSKRFELSHLWALKKKFFPCLFYSYFYNLQQHTKPCCCFIFVLALTSDNVNYNSFITNAYACVINN